MVYENLCSKSPNWITYTQLQMSALDEQLHSDTLLWELIRLTPFLHTLTVHFSISYTWKLAKRMLVCLREVVLQPEKVLLQAETMVGAY